MVEEPIILLAAWAAFAALVLCGCAEWVHAQTGIEAVFTKGSGVTTQLTATAGLRGRLVTSEGRVTYLD